MRTNGRSPTPTRPSRSATHRFEHAYRRCWAALHRADAPDLSARELELLRHVDDGDGVTLGLLAGRLALPKSSTSVLVKGLERRGFLRRRRDQDDERRLAIVLTAEGRRRVTGDRLLDPARLTAALRTLPRSDRARLLAGLERVAEAAERRGAAAVP
jgi:MarR family transcriptional regulator, organic hydroperoxide resistance regulator